MLATLRRATLSGDSSRLCHFCVMPSVQLTRHVSTDQQHRQLEKPRPAFSQAGFRQWVSADSELYQPATGRYHLYVSLACPWAHRTLITRKLKGLDEAISCDVVYWYLTDKGWQFDEKQPECTVDSVNGCMGMAQVYKIADPGYKGKYTVPVLWDKRSNMLVNNKSKDIIRMLNSNFNEFCRTEEQSKLDLYPEHLRPDMDKMIAFMSPNLTKGVYKTGRAITQNTYDKSVRNVFTALDEFDNILSKNRYLMGDTLTELDIRLYSALIRFDVAYHGHFKCNKKRIVDYPNLWPYLRELYQIPAFKETTNFEHIARFYQESQKQINPYGIVSIGPDLDLDAPHGRDNM